MSVLISLYKINRLFYKRGSSEVKLKFRLGSLPIPSQSLQPPCPFCRQTQYIFNLTVSQISQFKRNIFDAIYIVQHSRMCRMERQWRVGSLNVGKRWHASNEKSKKKPKKQLHKSLSHQNTISKVNKRFELTEIREKESYVHVFSNKK